MLQQVGEKGRYAQAVCQSAGKKSTHAHASRGCSIHGFWLSQQRRLSPEGDLAPFSWDVSSVLLSSHRSPSSDHHGGCQCLFLPPGAADVSAAALREVFGGERGAEGGGAPGQGLRAFGGEVSLAKGQEAMVFDQAALVDGPGLQLKAARNCRQKLWRSLHMYNVEIMFRPEVLELGFESSLTGGAKDAKMRKGYTREALR